MIDKFKTVTPYIWVKPLETPEKTESGIFLQTKAPQTKGEVVKISEFCDKETKATLSIGDIVLFNPEHPVRVSVDDQQYFLLMGRNIITTIDPSKVDTTKLE